MSRHVFFEAWGSSCEVEGKPQTRIFQGNLQEWAVDHPNRQVRNRRPPTDKQVETQCLFEVQCTEEFQEFGKRSPVRNIVFHAGFGFPLRVWAHSTKFVFSSDEIWVPMQRTSWGFISKLDNANRLYPVEKLRWTKNFSFSLSTLTKLCGAGYLFRAWGSLQRACMHAAWFWCKRCLSAGERIVIRRLNNCKGWYPIPERFLDASWLRRTHNSLDKPSRLLCCSSSKHVFHSPRCEIWSRLIWPFATRWPSNYFVFDRICGEKDSDENNWGPWSQLRWPRLSTVGAGGGQTKHEIFLKLQECFLMQWRFVSVWINRNRK